MTGQTGPDAEVAGGDVDAVQRGLRSWDEGAIENPAEVTGRRLGGEPDAGVGAARRIPRGPMNAFNPPKTRVPQWPGRVGQGRTFRERSDVRERFGGGLMYDIDTEPDVGKKDPVSRWLSVVILALLMLIIVAQMGINAGWIPAGWRP